MRGEGKVAAESHHHHHRRYMWRGKVGGGRDGWRQCNWEGEALLPSKVVVWSLSRKGEGERRRC
jgi:hypothetical protein